MALYRYQAKTQSGETQGGEQEAQSESDLAHRLKQKNLLLIFAKKKGAEEKSGFSFIMPWRLLGVSVVEKMMFSKNLALMLGAGVPLTKSLLTLAIQTKSSRFKKAIQDIAVRISKGETFSDSLREHIDIFGQLYASMIEAGEASGTVENVLLVLSRQLQKQHELISRVRGALMYPAVIVVAMTIIGMLMLIFVVPTLKAVFDELHADLPPATTFILGLGDFFSHYWWAVIAAVFFGLYMLKLALETQTGKRWRDWFFLHAPVLGGVLKEVYTAQFARTLASLIGGGVSILEGLRITSDTIGNHYYVESLSAAREKVQKGETLHSALEGYTFIYSPIIIQMIEVGEESGKLSEILEQLAEFYEDEVATITQNLSSLIEPILMIMIGAVVGFFAISIIQPMYTLVGKM